MILGGEYRDGDLYGKPERYSPTEHLFPDQRMTADSEQHQQQQRIGRPAPITGNLVLVAASSSNLSDVSLHSHSTHSSGSSQRGGDYREIGSLRSQGGSLPRTLMVTRSPEQTRRNTVHGTQSRDYVSSGHRRTGPSASSSSSISETSSSPRIARR